MRSLTDSSQATIQIDQVDIARRTVHGIDKTGGKFQAAYFITGTGFQIPQAGEYWTIYRHSNIWHLQDRFDQPGEVTKFNINPGDVHFRVPGNLYIDSPVISIGSGDIAATSQDSVIIGGTQSTFTLSGMPTHRHTIMAYKNGVFLHPLSDWTLSGNTLTFAVSLIANDKLTIYFQRTGAEYRESSTVTSVVDLSSTLDLPYKDISSETSVAMISAWESR